MIQVDSYFSENTPGEYATIVVRIANKYLPKNLQECEHRNFCSDKDMERIVTIYVSTGGRLTKNMLCLDSTELARAFSQYLVPIFKKRKYANNYEMDVIVESSHAIAKVNRWREKHTDEVNKRLHG